MRDDTVYLRYVVESIQLIEDYLKSAEDGLDHHRFLTGRRTQDAVLRRLETLADAAAHLSETLKSRHLDIPWRLITDFRNVLAHAYTDLQLEEVWAVIERDLDALNAIALTELQRLRP